MEQRKPHIIFTTLTGIIMMIFMIGSLTDRELFSFRFRLLGFPVEAELTTMQLLVPLGAVIVVLGMFGTLRYFLPVTGEQIVLHLFLPFSVTLTIGFTLRGIGGGLTGWSLLFLTALLLYLVLRFEYNACDPASARRPVSIIVLDGLCYAVFLLFVIALRANGSPLAVTVPSVFILCIVISLKTYSFHVINSSITLLAVITGTVMVFTEFSLHFWPVNIVSYGSLMFMWYYVFINLVIGKDHEETVRYMGRRILPAVVPALAVLIYAVIRL